MTETIEEMATRIGTFPCGNPLCCKHSISYCCIGSALREMRERCATTADGMIGATRHEIAAAIRRIGEAVNA